MSRQVTLCQTQNKCIFGSFASFYLHELEAKMASQLIACIYLPASWNNLIILCFTMLNEDSKVNRNAHLDNIFALDYFSSWFFVTSKIPFLFMGDNREIYKVSILNEYNKCLWLWKLIFANNFASSSQV